jgi:mono/diheme cytochrome c family protein
MTKMTGLVCLGMAFGCLAIAAGNPTAGKAVYAKACRSCHGTDGTPNAGIAKTFKVQMAHLGDPAVQSMSDDDLKAVITNGKGKMKPIKSVSGKAADDVVAFMRTLKK